MMEGSFNKWYGRMGLRVHITVITPNKANQHMQEGHGAPAITSLIRIFITLEHRNVRHLPCWHPPATRRPLHLYHIILLLIDLHKSFKVLLS